MCMHDLTLQKHIFCLHSTTTHLDCSYTLDKIESKFLSILRAQPGTVARQSSRREGYPQGLQTVQLREAKALLVASSIDGGAKIVWAWIHICSNDI